MSKNKKGAGKKKSMSFSSLNRFMIMQFILMIVLSLGITRIISSRARENAMEHLSAVTDERAEIIMSHVENAEALLDGFSRAPEVKEAILNQSADTKNAAQAYAEDYAKAIPGIDSIYVCDFSSKTIANSSNSTITAVICQGSELDRLQAALREALDENGKPTVYVYGVADSYTSGQTVFSLYKTIYDNDMMPRGFVGLSITTQSLIDKLVEMKTPGLEKSFYSMIDVKRRVYVFDEDMGQANKELYLPDLLEQCDIYENFDQTESTTYEFFLPDGVYAGGQNHGGKFVGASYFMPKYHWLLMMNDFQSEVYGLARTMRLFLGIFSLLIIAMMIIFGYLNKKQEKVNQKLLSSVEAVNETKKSLNTAMFGDILTGVGNRVKLATDLMGINDAKQNPYYFAMFNIMEFSNINTAYGSDTGDSLLVRTADTLKSQFQNGEIYRTGSDEFVVVIKTQNNTPQMSDVLFNVDEALKKLMIPENVRGLGTIHPKYKVAAIKKSSDIDASVITIMKEMTNVKGEAICGMIDFADMTE